MVNITFFLRNVGFVVCSEALSWTNRYVQYHLLHFSLQTNQFYYFKGDLIKASSEWQVFSLIETGLSGWNWAFHVIWVVLHAQFSNMTFCIFEPKLTLIMTLWWGRGEELMGVILLFQGLFQKLRIDSKFKIFYTFWYIFRGPSIEAVCSSILEQ